MNEVGEIINVEKCKCREMYVPDLKLIFNNYKAMSWGVRRLIIDNINSKFTKVLKFFVRGQHHYGYVYVFLNGLDLFDVYLTNNRDKIVDRTDEMGIYLDQLIDWIDEKVERIPEYTR